MEFDNFIIEPYQNSKLLFSNIDRDCIKIYDADLSGKYKIDILVKQFVFVGKFSKRDFETDPAYAYGFEKISGGQDWFFTTESSTITFPKETFPILKDKNDDEIKDFICTKFSDILHIALSEANKNVKISSTQINYPLTPLSQMHLDFIEQKGIFNMTYYYSSSKSQPLKKHLDYISLKSIRKTLLQHKIE